MEAGHVSPRITLGQVGERAEVTGRKPRPSGLGAEADAQLAAYRQHRFLRLAKPHRVLTLKRRNRVHGVRTPQRLGAALRQADVADLPGLHELRQRADGFLDRHRAVDAMQIEEIDPIGLKSREAALQ